MKPNTDRWFAKRPTGFCAYNSHMRSSFDEIHLTTHTNTGMSQLFDGMPDGSRQLHTKQLVGVQLWQRTNGPTVFPDAEIVEKCLHTESLGSVAGDDVRATFPTVLFTLPEAQRFHVPDTQHTPGVPRPSVDHLLVSIFDDNTVLRGVIDGTEAVAMPMPPGARHLLITAFWDSQFVNSFSVPLTADTIRDTLSELQGHFIGDEMRMHGMDAAGVLREQTETEAVSGWACALVVNLLLVMQSYPQFVKRADDRHQRPHVYRDKPPPVTYMMGRVAPLLPRPVPDAPRLAGNAGGNHAAPRVHWRRGHWRRQPHTPAFMLLAASRGEAPKEVSFPDGRMAHMVWIEPVFVGMQQLERDSNDRQDD